MNSMKGGNETVNVKKISGILMIALGGLIVSISLIRAIHFSLTYRSSSTSIFLISLIPNTLMSYIFDFDMFDILSIILLVCGIIMLNTSSIKKKYHQKAKSSICYIILLLIGFLPFALVLLLSIACGIFGFTFFSSTTYGFTGFIDAIVIYSYIFWPLYILGAALIILSFVNMYHIKREKRNITVRQAQPLNNDTTPVSESHNPQDNSGVKLNNIILPIWLLWVFPSYLWLIILPANLLVDGLVLLITMKLLDLSDIKRKLLSCVFKTWIFGFISDLIGVAFLLPPVFIWDDSALAYGISVNPFSFISSFLWVTMCIIISGLAIYLFNYKIALNKLNDITPLQKKKLALSLSIVTAPYLYYLPTILFYG